MYHNPEKQFKSYDTENVDKLKQIKDQFNEMNLNESNNFSKFEVFSNNLQSKDKDTVNLNLNINAPKFVPRSLIETKMTDNSNLISNTVDFGKLYYKEDSPRDNCYYEQSIMFSLNRDNPYGIFSLIT